MIKCRLALLMAGYPAGPLNMKQVAEALGIRPSTVSDLYYSRMKRVDVEQMGKLCRLFGCQPGDLFAWEEEPGPARRPRKPRAKS